MIDRHDRPVFSSFFALPKQCPAIYVYLRQYSAILRQQIPTLDFAAALRAEFDRASRGPKRECQFVESRARGSTTFYAKVTSMALCHRS